MENKTLSEKETDSYEQEDECDNNIVYFDEKMYSNSDDKKAINECLKELDDNYFDMIYTSNRYWVMNNRKMTDKKFQDILTLICKDFFKKHFGELVE